MKRRRLFRKLISIAYIIFGITSCIVLLKDIDLPNEIRSYFRFGYYSQYGQIVISIELAIAGFNLFLNHEKTNFVMALFGFTAIFDIVCSFLNSSQTYISIIFLCFALASLKIAFYNSFNSGKISKVIVAITFVFGLITELFFNYL
ncbi:MAG: hypothetical protein Wins2KO_22540 [Winogradskyella sp.]